MMYSRVKKRWALPRDLATVRARRGTPFRYWLFGGDRWGNE